MAMFMAGSFLDDFWAFPRVVGQGAVADYAAWRGRDLGRGAGMRCGAAAGAWKRRRYSAGPTPSERRKTRRIVSAVPNPQLAATDASGSGVSSRRRRAASR